MSVSSKILRRQKVKRGIRAKLKGTQKLPRLSIYKSNTRIYAFLVNDDINKVLVSVSSCSINDKKKNYNLDVSHKTGELIAQKAKKLGINSILFDRSGYIYHGNVKALAEGARKSGLKF